MKKISLILLMFCALGINAQEYKTSDGTIFYENDTIAIGKPSSTFGYKHIAHYNDGVKCLKEDLSFKEFTIKNLVSEHYGVNQFYGNKAKSIMQIGETGFLGVNYYINIDQAVRDGEIIIRQNRNPANYEALSDERAFLYFVKSYSEPADSLKEEFFHRFMVELHNQTKEDEFEYYKSLKKAKENIEIETNKMTFGNYYSLHVKCDLSKYDFEAGGFYLENLEPIYTLIDYGMFSGFPALKIVLSNIEEYKLIKVDEDFASSLIKRRKSESGNVDREVYLTINFSIIEPNEKVEKLKDNILAKKIVTFKTDEKDRFIYSKISSIEVYEFEYPFYQVGI